MKIKKITAAVIAMVLMGTIAVTASAGTFAEGGKYTAKDATLILKDIAGIEKLTGTDRDAADLDGDGSITAKDVTLVLKKIAGLPTDDEGYVTIQGKRYDIATTDSLHLQGLTEAITDEDVKNIGKLKDLTELTLAFASISDISPLTGLTNLKFLNLGLNEISDLKPLEGLTDLTQLSLHINDISDISPLAKLTNLKALDLNTNQISDISPLAGLTNLEQLSLRGNQISDISPLMGLTNLTDMYLYDNPISDSDMESLKSALPNCNII